jgi:hypothetical protein
MGEHVTKPSRSPYEGDTISVFILQIGKVGNRGMSWSILCYYKRILQFGQFIKKKLFLIVMKAVKSKIKGPHLAKALFI